MAGGEECDTSWSERLSWSAQVRPSRMRMSPVGSSDPPSAPSSKTTTMEGRTPSEAGWYTRRSATIGVESTCRCSGKASPAGATSNWHCTAGANTPGRGSTVHAGSVWLPVHGTQRPASQRASLGQPAVAEHPLGASTQRSIRQSRPPAQSLVARHSGVNTSATAPSAVVPRSAGASMLVPPRSTVVSRASIPRSLRASSPPASRPPASIGGTTVPSSGEHAALAIVSASAPIHRSVLMCRSPSLPQSTWAARLTPRVGSGLGGGS